MPTFYLRSDVEALFAGARQGAPNVVRIPPGARTVEEISLAGAPFPTTLAMLLDRRLTCVGVLVEGRGLYGLCVEQGEWADPCTQRLAEGGGREHHAWLGASDGETRPRRIEVYHGTIMAAIKAGEDSTTAALASMLQRRHGVSFSPSTIWRFLQRYGIQQKRG